jgi:hypothetical protein
MHPVFLAVQNSGSSRDVGTLECESMSAMTFKEMEGHLPKKKLELKLCCGTRPRQAFTAVYGRKAHMSIKCIRCGKSAVGGSWDEVVDGWNAL